MEISEKNREFISRLYSESDGKEICELFDKYSKNYKRAVLIYFNSSTVNKQLEKFKNNIINGYSIMGVSNYEKAYILDKKFNSKSNRVLALRKIINLDLNVLTYLKKIVANKKVEDEKNFIAYLKYIKDSKYGLNMSISLMERISKPFPEKILSDYILSYVKYDTLNNITKDSLRENIALPESRYKQAKEILDFSSYREEHFNVFYIISCLLSKAFILKMEKKS